MANIIEFNVVSRRRLFAFALATVLMVSIMTTAAMSSIRNAYAANDNWYVGKGAQPNTYYTYKIQNGDTDNGQPFTMNIYFKQFNSTGGYWIAPAYVVSQGQVFNGTFHLSDLDLSVLGTSKIPDNMSEYASAYSTSLHWLASFVTKATSQSLSAPYWGKIASIGGSP